MLGTGTGDGLQLEPLKQMRVFNLDEVSLRELNQALHDCNGSDEASAWTVTNTKGKHAVAAGIDAPLEVTVNGHVGYYCAGMNKQGQVTIRGNTGPGVAENMMSGLVRVTGNASQYAGASAHGGLLVIEGDAGSRCGISMKGVDIVVRGSIGHMGAFMAQKGRLVICGDAGTALGDSLYEARIYVKGKVAGLGADCVEKPMAEEHERELEQLLEQAGINGVDAAGFRRYGSARKLYHFNVDNVDAY